MKTLETKIIDLYHHKGHYKHLISRKLGCDKVADYIHCIDCAGELIDPFLIKLFFITARNTYTEYNQKYRNHTQTTH